MAPILMQIIMAGITVTVVRTIGQEEVTRDPTIAALLITEIIATLKLHLRDDLQTAAVIETAHLVLVTILDLIWNESFS